MSQVRVLHMLHWKCNCSCVVSRLRNNSSKFYKISSVLNKIMLKILWPCFFVDTVQQYHILRQFTCINLSLLNTLLQTICYFTTSYLFTSQQKVSVNSLSHPSKICPVHQLIQATTQSFNNKVRHKYIQIIGGMDSRYPVIMQQ